MRFASPTGRHERRLRPDLKQNGQAQTLINIKDVRDLWSQDLSDAGLRSSLDDSRQVLRNARSRLRSVPSSEDIAAQKANRKARAVGPWGDLSKSLREKGKSPEGGQRRLTRLYFHPRVPKQVAQWPFQTLLLTLHLFAGAPASARQENGGDPRDATRF